MDDHGSSTVQGHDYPMLRFATRYMWCDSSGHPGTSEEVTAAIETAKRHCDPQALIKTETFLLYLDERGGDLDAPLSIALTGEETERGNMVSPDIGLVLDILFDGPPKG